MTDLLIWILLGMVLFLLVNLIVSQRERKQLRAGLGAISEKMSEEEGQMETLIREKEILAGQLEEAKKSSEKNQKLAFYDPTTGLPNEIGRAHV